MKWVTTQLIIPEIKYNYTFLVNLTTTTTRKTHSSARSFFSNIILYSRWAKFMFSCNKATKKNLYGKIEKKSNKNEKKTKNLQHLCSISQVVVVVVFSSSQFTFFCRYLFAYFLLFSSIVVCILFYFSPLCFVIIFFFYYLISCKQNEKEKTFNIQEIF